MINKSFCIVSCLVIFFGIGCLGAAEKSQAPSILKEVVHQGLSDADVLKIAEKMERDPISYEPFIELEGEERKVLRVKPEELVVVANRKQVMTLESLRDLIKSGFRKDPFTNEPFSQELINYAWPENPGVEMRPPFPVFELHPMLERLHQMYFNPDPDRSAIDLLRQIYRVLSNEDARNNLFHLFALAVHHQADAIDRAQGVELFVEEEESDEEDEVLGW